MSVGADSHSVRTHNISGGVWDTHTHTQTCKQDMSVSGSNKLNRQTFKPRVVIFIGHFSVVITASKALFY